MKTIIKLKIRFIAFFIVQSILISSAFCQTPIFDETIIVNQTFTADDTIFPFNDESIYGIGVSGNIQFNSDTSLVRILIADATGLEYMIYETYPMLDTVWNFSFTEKCEETCFMDGFAGNSVFIQIVNATLQITQFDFTTTSVSDATTLQSQAKAACDELKIEKLSAFIHAKDMIWFAGETVYSTMYYKDRVNFYGQKANTYGFEFYTGGIFEIYGMIGGYQDPTYNIVSDFDWRSRHGANDVNSFYYDGDENGSGWMTDIRCQTGCWVSGNWECITQSECTALGGIWRATGACTAFGNISAVEGISNLYFNQHVNFDLSEQQLASDGTNNPNCAGVLNGGTLNEVLIFIEENGVVDEACFPFQGWDVPCEQMCDELQVEEKVFISGFESVQFEYAEELKQALIQNGPMPMAGVWSQQNTHAMTLVGFGTVKVGDILGDENEILIITPFHRCIGMPYWIYKDNYGLQKAVDGYYKAFWYQKPTEVRKIQLPIISMNYEIGDVLCLDKDNDGYFNWGISTTKPESCPTCPDEKDGNDSDPSLGPVDDNGFCTIINTYHNGFEGFSDDWKQTDSDDGDWIKNTGTTYWPGHGPQSAYEGDYYMLFDGLLNASLDPNSTAIFESPLIEITSECFLNLQFSYFNYFEGYVSRLSIEISGDGGTTWGAGWTDNCTSNDEDWHQVSLNLPGNTNKIRFIATTGIYPADMAIGIDDITISASTVVSDWIVEGVWSLSGEYYACGNIIIEEGSELKLLPGCNLFMNSENKIVVKRGAKLRLYEASISSASNSLWEGIELWGNNNMPSNHVYQGMVSLLNGSSIKNAKCGIKTTRCSGIENDGLPEYSGGIISVYDASFVNNQRAIEFFPYSGDDEYFGSIKNCVFELNDDIFPGTTVNEIVKATYFDHIPFKYVTFTDNRTQIPIEERPTGILANGSYISINGMQISNVYYNSSFHNLKYGVKALGVTPDEQCSVQFTDFYNNLRGLYVSGINNLLVLSSSFHAYESLTEPDETYGLYLDNCTGYVVEGNTFINDDVTTRKGIGVIINESGSDANEVYRNSFTRLDFGILAQNRNRSSSGITGLCLSCNDFDECNFDLTTTTDFPGEDPELGIAANQGANSTSPEDMAGNLFYIESLLPDGDFDDIDNQLQHINYYYPFNVDPIYANVKPVDYTRSTVTAKRVTVSEQWNYEIGCPSNQTGGGGTDGHEKLLSALNESNQKTDSIQNVLDLLTDAGDTEALQTEVYTATPGQTMDIYTELINSSPYLSDTVVEKAIENENALPGVMIRDIMVANPQSSKSDRLITKLDERLNPLPDYMKAQILQGRTLVSLKEETESNLTQWELKKEMAFDGLVSYFMNDTLNPAGAQDSLIALLSGNNSLNSKYLLAFHYLLSGNAVSGEAVLSNIPGQFVLNATQLANYQQMMSYYSLIKEAMMDTANFFLADSALIAPLFGIMNSDNGVAGSYARNVLLALEQTSYDEPVILPDLFKSSQANDEFEKMLKTPSPKFISVKPNPAKDYLIIEYATEKTGNIFIEITNLERNQVYGNNFIESTNQLMVDTRNWKAGLYVVSLYQSGKLIDSEKFTLIH